MKNFLNLENPSLTLDPLENKLFFSFALFLLVLPIWVVSYPPMVDIPQHMAQINSLKFFWGGDEYFQSIFEVNWFTPYLVGYLSVYLLSQFFPLLISLKLVLSLSLIGLPISLRRLFQVAEVDPAVVWLTFPATVGFSFYFGFLNFLVATPVAIFFLVIGIEFEKDPTRKKAVGLMLLSVLLFFCHLLALGFCLSILGLIYLAKNYKNLRLFFVKLIPLAPPIPLTILWLFLTHGRESQTSGVIIFDISVNRVLVLLKALSGSDMLALMLIISALILLYPPLSGAKLSRKPWRWVPLAVSLLIFFAFPRYIFGTGSTYPRFGPFVGIFWLLIWDYKPLPPKYLRWLVFICILALFCFTTTRFRLWEQENNDFKTVLQLMEPNKKVLSLMVDHRSKYFGYPLYLHYGAWYQAENRGIVDFSFAMFFPEMLRYKKSAIPKIPFDFEWQPTIFNWQRHGGSNYYYFLVRAPVNIGKPIFKNHLHNVRLKANIGNWWLYENTGGMQ